MFKSMMTSLSICLQGSILQRRERPRVKSAVTNESAKPQPVFVSKNYLLKDDGQISRKNLFLKMHEGNGRLVTQRDGSRKARAHWCPDHYEQHYNFIPPGCLDPQVEIYCRMLGLTHADQDALRLS